MNWQEAHAAGDEVWIAQIQRNTPGLLKLVGAFSRKGTGLVETVGPPKIIRH